jgi:hypothetical protein
VIVVSVNMFILATGVGAAAIALWAEVRFPNVGPERLLGCALHLLMASLVAHLVVPAALETAPNKVLAIFVVALPALIYVFLTAIWIMKLARSAFGGGLPQKR